MLVRTLSMRMPEKPLLAANSFIWLLVPGSCPMNWLLHLPGIGITSQQTLLEKGAKTRAWQHPGMRNWWGLSHQGKAMILKPLLE